MSYQFMHYLIVLPKKVADRSDYLNNDDEI